MGGSAARCTSPAAWKPSKRLAAGDALLLVAAGLCSGACADLRMDADVVPTSLIVSPADTMLTVGDEAGFSVLVLDQHGRVIDPSPSWALPRWSSLGPEKVHMSPDGTAEAVRFGETSLEVSFAGLRGHTRVRANPASVDLSVSAYHLTQGVQNTVRGVPLIAGRRALLRVFVTGDRESYYQPVVEAFFYRNNLLVRRFTMKPEFEVLPVAVHEGRLDHSYDAMIPGSLVEPGTEMLIEVDRERLVPISSGSQLRVPAAGRDSLDVRVLPRLELTVVPVVTVSDTGTDVYNWTEGMNAASEQLRHAQAVLPLGGLTVNVHKGFMTSADLTMASGWSQLLGELTFLRVTEGERGYYYGAVTPGDMTTAQGLGFIGYPVAVGRADAETLAHEVGHNLSLRHAPCGGAIAPDTNFPYPGGSIGVWGYDFNGKRLVNASLYRDFMGYCTPSWVSDYHFTRAMEFRLNEESALVSGSAQNTGPVPAADAVINAGSARGTLGGSSGGSDHGTLLLWGRVGPAELVLDPAFVVDLPVTLPEGDGPYRLDGFGTGGERLFALSFSPRPVAGGGGNFLFAVPFDPAVDGPLERVVLSGPEGQFTLEQFGSGPMAIVKERGSGRVRAILRNWTGAELGSLGLAPGDAEILVSEGLPR